MSVSAHHIGPILAFIDCFVLLLESSIIAVQTDQTQTKYSVRVQVAG
jgi:hypothetical protein